MYADHVITLSAIGDAETPAGGSVCIRCVMQSAPRLAGMILVNYRRRAYLEISHQSSSSGGRHDDVSAMSGGSGQWSLLERQCEVGTARYWNRLDLIRYSRQLRKTWVFPRRLDC